jgi:hypothetical protein
MLMPTSSDGTRITSPQCSGAGGFGTAINVAHTEPHRWAAEPAPAQGHADRELTWHSNRSYEEDPWSAPPFCPGPNRVIIEV